MINIVTIDPSPIGTAVTVNGVPYSFPSESSAVLKSGKLRLWFDMCSDYATIKPIDTSYNKEKSYSQLEMNKLVTFQKTSNLIRKTVDNNCNPAYNTLCLIEGYSYSSAEGPLIDLVTFGTMLRRQFFTRTNTEMVVLAPSTVKRLAAKLTYPAIQKGKKVEYRNNEGIAGGSFKKPDIYKVLTENDEIDSDWVNFLRDIQKNVIALKNVPKPIEDINDSVVMYYIAERTYRDCKQDYNQTIRELKKA